MEKTPGVYTYIAKWPISTLAWSVRRRANLRLAVASHFENPSNKIELLQFNPDTTDFTTDTRLIFPHPYTPTNLMFSPAEESDGPDLIATSGDYIRLWEIHEDRVELKSTLTGNKTNELNWVVTSFDWAHFDPRRLAQSSVDTTCTVWDLEREIIDTQLVAHDKEVYDISWGGYNVFASVSGDGSVRVLDLRDKERSTIIYDNPVRDCPLLRLEWSKADPRYIATVGMDSNKVVVLDIRFPTSPLVELCKHKASVNAVSWDPFAGRRICSVGDDSRALIWDLDVVKTAPEMDVEPDMWYETTAEINCVRWSPVDFNLIAVGFLNKLQIVKV